MKIACRIALAMAACLVAAPAFAGSAPAAWYPSMWVYGGSPTWAWYGAGQGNGRYAGPPANYAPPAAYTGDPVYYNGPQAYTGDPAYVEGPPQGYTGDPAYYNAPPEGYTGDPAYGGSSGGYGGGYSSQSYGASRGHSYSGGSVSSYTYDSGWRDPNTGALLPGERPYEDSRSRTYGDGSNWHDRDGARDDARGGVYAGGSVQEYDYDSGWHGGPTGGGYYEDRGQAVPPPHCPVGPPPPPPVTYQGPPEERHLACPLSYEGEHLPGTFFADAGGVGPDYIAGGGGGGGGYAMAGASAGAYAAAGAHVSIHAHGHGGGHGCGCGKH